MWFGQGPVDVLASPWAPLDVVMDWLHEEAGDGHMRLCDERGIAFDLNHTEEANIIQAITWGMKAGVNPAVMFKVYEQGGVYHLVAQKTCGASS